MLVFIQTSHQGNTSKMTLICNKNSECRVNSYLPLHPNTWKRKIWRSIHYHSFNDINKNDSQTIIKMNLRISEQNESTYEGLILLII